MEVVKKNSLQSPTFTYKNKMIRVLWSFTYMIFFRYSPVFFFPLRVYLLNLFGAKVSKKARVYPSAKIWLPSNLEMGSGSTLGPNVEVYNQGKITIGKNVIISQGAYLCASTHEYNDRFSPLVLSPIHIKDDAWICAKSIIAPGVTIGEGSVVGLGSVMPKDAEDFGVYAGNPARLVKLREFRS